MNRRPNAAAHAALAFAAASALAAPLAIAATPRAAYAQEVAASAIARVPLPKGAVKFGDGALAAGLGRLTSDGAEMWGLPRKAGNAEVYVWDGPRYKPGRTAFTVAVLQGALEEAGYTYRAIDWGSENVPKAFDDHAYNTGAMNLQPVDGIPNYFTAVDAAKGRAVVGGWFDQKSQKRLILVIGPAGSLDAPTATKVPDLADPDAWLVKNLKNAAEGLPAAPMPAFPKLAKKPGFVRGLVKDAAGRPISGAQIVAWSSAAGGFRSEAKGRTNAQGVYEIPLPVGIGQVVNADCRVSYNGKSMVMPLHPVDGEREHFDTRAGAVENFVLRTSGASGEGKGNYGGTVRILSYEIPVGAVIEVSMKPAGALADGSRGKTLVFRFKNTKPSPLSMETFLGGIPVGRYTLTAKVYDGEDSLPLRARNNFNDDGSEPQLGRTLDVEFKDNGLDGANLGSSNLRRFDVVVQP